MFSPSPKGRRCANDTDHVSLAHNLVSLRNKFGINGVAIGDIKEALPQVHQVPQGLKRFTTVVTHDPSENSSFEVVYGSPQPDFVFLEPTKVSNSSSSPTSGIVSGS